MMRRPSVRRVWHSAAGRFFAALLIALTVMPFTAPFSAFDVSEVTGEAIKLADLSTAKDKIDAAVFNSIDCGTALVEILGGEYLPRLATVLDNSPLPTDVLRL